MAGTERIETLISKEALAQFEQLKKLSDENVSAFEKLIAKTVELNKQLGGAKTIKQVVDGTKEMDAAEKELEKQSKQVAAARAKLEASYTKEVRMLAELREQQKQLNAEIKIEAELNISKDGTIAQQRAQLKKLIVDYEKLTKAEREAGQGDALLQQIQDLDLQVKKFEFATGRFQRNVGNYPGAARIIVEALEKAKNKFETLSKSADATPAALQRAKTEFEALRGITDNKQFLNFSGKMGDATQEVRTFTRTLNNLKDQGLQNSDVYKALEKRLAELTDQIGDTKASIKALASDTRTFDLFASSVSFAADVFQTAAGAAVAFGASEEDAAEATKTLFAIQNIANGVKGIANELTTKGTAANKLYEFSQRQLATAFDESATAGARFKAILISLGIGAIIVGIGLLVANLSKIKGALSGASDAQKKYNDILEESGSEFSSAAKLVGELAVNIGLAKDGILNKEQVVKQYNDTIGKTTGTVKNLDEAEKELVKNGPAYVRMMLLKAAAQKALEEAANEAFKTELQSQKSRERISRIRTDDAEGIGEFIKRGEENLRKASEQAGQKRVKTFEDIAKKFQEEAAKIAKDSGFDFFGGEQEEEQKKLAKKFYDELLKAEADQFKKLSENEQGYLTTRLSARQKAYSIERQILAGQQRVEIENAEGSAEKIAEINKEFSIKRILLQQQLGADVIAIRQSFIAHERQLEEEAHRMFLEDQEKNKVDLLDVEDRAFQRRQNFLEENRDILLKSIEAERNAKMLSAQTDKERQKIEEEANNKRKEVELRTNAEILAAALDVAQKKLALVQDPQQTSALEAQIANIKKELEELRGESIDLDNSKATQKVAEVVGKIKEIGDAYQTMFSTIGDLLSISEEQEKAKIETDLANIDKRTEKEIAAVNASTASEQQKKEAIALIEARAQSQREALERRQRAIELQRARFEKAATIARIISDTAAAVVAALGAKPFTPANIAQAVVVGALGAVQLAKAAAAPLPKFASGTDDAPGGLAWVGDAYRSELMVTPKGELIETPAVPTVMNVPKHSIIFPDSKQSIRAITENIAVYRSPVLVDHGRYYKEMTSEIKNELRLTRRAIVNKKEIHIHRSRDGWRTITKSGGNETNYLNDNLQH